MNEYCLRTVTNHMVPGLELKELSNYDAGWPGGRACCQPHLLLLPELESFGCGCGWMMKFVVRKEGFAVLAGLLGECPK
jgi:hypothetical protein